MKKMLYPALVILSSFLFGIVPALTRYTFDYGGNSMNINFFMALISVPVLYLKLKTAKLPVKVSRSNFRKIATLSLFGSSVAPLILMFSYHYIPTGMAITLHFVYPVVVAFALVLFFKEKLSAWKIVALVVAVAGIAAMSLDGVEANIAGIGLALLSGVCWAFYILYLDKSGLTELDPYLLSFYVAIFTLLISAAIGLSTGSLTPLTAPKAWGMMAVASIVGGVLAGPCFQMGIKGTGSLAAGILSTFEPITSVVVGILFLGESSSAGKVAGCILVLLGVCLIVYANYKESQGAGQSA